MYGLEWLIVWALLGAAGGLAIGVRVARGQSTQAADRARQLEGELAASRRELDAYRQEVVAQFSETARKFQSLNDAYTDLHQQLAKSSSMLCGDISGPLLQAPQGHQDLIPADIREPSSRPELDPESAEEGPPGASPGTPGEEATRGEEAANGEGAARGEEAAVLRGPAAKQAAETDPLEPQGDSSAQPQKAPALHGER